MILFRPSLRLWNSPVETCYCTFFLLPNKSLSVCMILKIYWFFNIYMFIGKGDMAVAQAMGSNVFDILLGLGLPWILKTLIFDPNSTIEVQSVGLIISCLSIFVSVVLFIVLVCYYEFKLVKRIGYILVLAYVVFIFISILLEVFVWSGYHLPTCKLDI